MRSAIRFVHVVIGVAAAVAVLAFLVAGSGMVLPSAAVYADSTCGSGSGFPCTLGPNLEIISATKGNGLGCGGAGATLTPITSPMDPGFTLTGNSLCTKTTSVTSALTLALSTLNGFSIGDISGSVTCGVTAGSSVTVSIDGFTALCPTEAAGVTDTVSIPDSTITPTMTLSDVITISEIIAPGGSASVSAGSENFSLLAPTTAPEPGSLSLLLLGLVGLPFARRRFAR